MDYKDTLNLPDRSFPMKANLVNKEPEQLKEWEKEDLYKYIQKQREEAPLYVLHDGPPYANGNIHVGTALNKILKDIIIKYKTMRGYNAPYIPGWDMHGLPIEHKVTSQIDNSENISKLDIRKKCRKYAEKYFKIQREQFKRLGVRGDWDNPYLTYDFGYESSVIKVFSELVKKGYVYRKRKPIYWCTHCETALAEAEVEYHNHTSHSIYVKFQDNNDPKRFFIIWTTTPWTLPANVAIALHPDYEYVEILVGDEHWVIAKELLDSATKDMGINNYQIVDEKKGRNYEGIKTQHPFMDRLSEIVLADYVALDAGTGCIHTAPGHGEEDYQTGNKYNLPVISPVDDSGVFTSDAGKYEGLFVFDANDKIVSDLKDHGYLVAADKLEHSYPHCWRCKNPVIFRATEQWFVSIDHNKLRDKALEEIKKTKWYPYWGERRISSMIADRPDWCISRQRSWGIPIPAFKCEKCGEVVLSGEIVDHFASLVEKHGTDIWFEWEAKDLLPDGFSCPECGSDTFSQHEDILDVWIDSGSSFEAVVKQRPELRFPADEYLEGSDQHRGWFNSSLLLSLVVEDKAPFDIVVTHGFINDEQGRKMSKSAGNVVDTQEINEKYGAEILRMWVASSNYHEDIRISNKIIRQQIENYRKIRNTIRYLIGNLSDFNRSDSLPYEKLAEIDKWALMKLNILIKDVTKSYEEHEFYKANHLIMKFLINDMSSFYLDIVKDRLYVEGKDSETRKSVQTAMMEILLNLTKLLSPVLTFTTEEVYKFLPRDYRKYKTIQVENWPEYNKDYFDENLDKKWKKLRAIREDVLKALETERNQKNIGNSLDARVILKAEKKETEELLRDYTRRFLEDFFIVSQVEIDSTVEADNIHKGQIVDVVVKKAQGKKCERCWKYSTDVGKDEQYKDICGRCADVLKKFY
ncbi:MAG: isoleucine--tRNA ligase [Kosmotoga sp.]|nr:MAG: isoleucine--tRNA ligase [Kosmotoga sp.]